MKSLEDFAKWWFENRPIRPLFDAVSQPANGISGIVLYREGQFQVQLFIFQPNITITNHRHPNVDSYEHYLSGEVFFYKNGKELLPREDFYALSDGTAAPLLNKDKPCNTRVSPKDWHGADIGSRGGSFLSVQKWLDGKPSLVERDWIGEPLGGVHADLIAQKEMA